MQDPAPNTTTPLTKTALQLQWACMRQSIDFVTSTPGYIALLTLAPGIPSKTGALMCADLPQYLQRLSEDNRVLYTNQVVAQTHQLLQRVDCPA